MYNVGITGSRDIDPIFAQEKIEEVLYVYQQNFGRELQLITGACLGIDALVAQIACGFNIKVHTVLPNNRTQIDRNWKVWCTSYEEMPKGTTYRARDEKIVVLSKEVIGFPSCDEKQKDGTYTKSGTWMTLRIAKRYDRETLIIRVNKEKENAVL
jgi:hypothetical protein